MSTPNTTPPAAGSPTLKELVDLYRIDEQLIRAGGGKSAINRQHEKGRLTARERIELLLDGAPETTPDQLKGVLPSGGTARFQELGMWCAHGMYQEHGGAPSAGVVTGIGRVCGKQCMIIANDATVKAGAFFPMTCKKIIRAQTIAHAARMPLIYLVDSAGVFLPMQEDVFPDTDDFGRIFRNNAIISAEGIPQIAAIMGYCVAGGGYLPVLCDTLLMTEGSGLYLAGPALVKAAIGQDVTDEELGGAQMHAAVSGTIDFREKDDVACIARVRSLVSKYPPASHARQLAVMSRMMKHAAFTPGFVSQYGDAANDLEKFKAAQSPEERQQVVEQLRAKPRGDYWEHQLSRQASVLDAQKPEALRALYLSLAGEAADQSTASSTAPARSPDLTLSVYTDKPGTQYDVRDVIACIVDAKAGGTAAPQQTIALEADFDEYKPEYGQSIVCGYAKINGHACGIVANQKKLVRSGKGQTQMPGVIYDDSADKSARFIMDCNQRKVPIVFLHDTTGFMVGRDSEQGGIIRAGAKMVNAMANCVVPKIVVIIGGSYGAGNYAMCGRAFDQFISFAWPNAKCAVMGANQATGVLTMIEEASRKRKGETIDPETHKQIYGAIHAGYTEQADIRHAAARGWVDRLIEPQNTRAELSAALDACANWDYSRTFRTGVIQT